MNCKSPQYPQADVQRELWERGEIFWKFHAGQLLLEMNYQQLAISKLFVADCSRQLGKSTWAAGKCVEKALKKPGARIRYATAFKTDLEQFVIPAFDFILADIPDHLRPIWRASKMEFFFPSTRSSIRLVGLDLKPNGLRGNKLDMAVLDEAAFIKRLGYLYRSVILPTMTHVPDGRIIMLSTQPEDPDHEFVKFCDRAEAQGCYVKLEIDDNPLLTEHDKEEIALEYAPADLTIPRHVRVELGRKSTGYRREYKCARVVEEQRAIIADFDLDRHVKVTPPGPAHKFWNRIEALDSAGGTHKTGCLLGYYDFGRAKLVIEGEVRIDGHETTTRRIADDVKTQEKEIGGYENVAIRSGDNNNPILLRDLGTEHGLHFAPTTKDDLHAMVNKVRLWFQSDRIEIHPRCKLLIGALRAGIWNPQRTEFAFSEVHGHFDLIAALVYMVRNVPEHDNPVPPFFGYNLSEVVFPGGAHRQNSNAETLRRAFFGGR